MGWGREGNKEFLPQLRKMKSSGDGETVMQIY